jgi:hypothetical protein
MQAGAFTQLLIRGIARRTFDVSVAGIVPDGYRTVLATPSCASAPALAGCRGRYGASA